MRRGPLNDCFKAAPLINIYLFTCMTMSSVSLARALDWCQPFVIKGGPLPLSTQLVERERESSIEYGDKHTRCIHSMNFASSMVNTVPMALSFSASKFALRGARSPGSEYSSASCDNSNEIKQAAVEYEESSINLKIHETPINNRIPLRWC